ncbi:hypothetical protein MP638_007179 [Amoeboaphelidium occidentale]|nr:hypothetical protein MP638_007179 [Amoeboaphelidium occidentale]
MKAAKKSFYKKNRQNLLKRTPKAHDDALKSVDYSATKCIDILVNGSNDEKLIALCALQKLADNADLFKDLMKANFADVMLPCFADNADDNVSIEACNCATAYVVQDYGFGKFLLKKDYLRVAISCASKLKSKSGAGFHFLCSLLDCCSNLDEEVMKYQLPRLVTDAIFNDKLFEGSLRLLVYLVDACDNISWFYLYEEQINALVQKSTDNDSDILHRLLCLKLCGVYLEKEEVTETEHFGKLLSILTGIAEKINGLTEEEYPFFYEALDLVVEIGLLIASMQPDEVEGKEEDTTEVEPMEEDEIEDTSAQEGMMEGIEEMSMIVAEADARNASAKLDFRGLYDNLIQITFKQAASIINGELNVLRSFIYGRLCLLLSETRQSPQQGEFPEALRVFFLFADNVLSGNSPVHVLAGLECTSSLLLSNYRELLGTLSAEKEWNDVFDKCNRIIMVSADQNNLAVSLRTDMVMIIGAIGLVSGLPPAKVNDVSSILLSNMDHSKAPQEIAEAIDCFLDLFGPDTYDELFKEKNLVPVLREKIISIRKVAKSIDPRPRKNQKQEAELSLVWDEDLLPDSREIKDRLIEMSQNLERFAKYKCSK